MKGPDLEKERSERPMAISHFLAEYNETLPPSFPRASMEALRVFRKTYPSLFKEPGVWALGPHRKKFMDWLPQYLKSQS